MTTETSATESPVATPDDGGADPVIDTRHACRHLRKAAKAFGLALLDYLDAGGNLDTTEARALITVRGVTLELVRDLETMSAARPAQASPAPQEHAS